MEREPVVVITTLAREHATDMYNLRHSDDVSKFSTNPPPTWNQHLAFVDSVINKKALPVYVATIDDKFVGCVSRSMEGYVNIMVSAVKRNMGIGRKLLRHMQAYGHTLNARIHCRNIASIRLFESCEFVWTGYDNSWNVYEWRK